ESRKKIVHLSRNGKERCYGTAGAGFAFGAALPSLEAGSFEAAPLPGAAAGDLRISSKYCCTNCWYISGTSSRWISPPASACLACRCENGVLSCCLVDPTSTITSPDTL